MKSSLLLITLLLIPSILSAESISGTINTSKYTKESTIILFLDGVETQHEQKQSIEVRINRKNRTFDPKLLTVIKGTTVTFVNEDEFSHSAFSFSETKTFEFGMENPGSSGSVTFDKTGRVDTFCAIHPQMHAVIFVLPNIYFAQADKNGNYTIKNVEQGKYTLKIWIEETETPITLKEVIVNGKDLHLDFN
ncbi:MAG: cupredoxin domain-containing protein [Nitrospinae bacterium]|nr:cupredoxin domain-containing protein [Nitrospinota bacterium]